MGSLSGLGIGLSFVVGCILMGFVAELLYLLWWKKRATLASTTNSKIEGFSPLFCWKKPIKENPSEDLEMGPNKNLGSESVEAELMRLHNLCGPPRFLFTIKEESKEDLESEDGKSRRTFSDLLFATTPLSSPTLGADCKINHGFNPLFDSEVRSSPPPKFKFLQDAEDKLIRKLLMEEAERKRAVQDSAIKGAQVLPLNSSPTFRDKI